MPPHPAIVDCLISLPCHPCDLSADGRVNTCRPSAAGSWDTQARCQLSSSQRTHSTHAADYPVTIGSQHAISFKVLYASFVVPSPNRHYPEP